MRSFLSPGERRLLDSLPENEAAVVRALFDELDAHLLPDHEPAVSGRLPDPSFQPALWRERKDLA